MPDELDQLLNEYKEAAPAPQPAVQPLLDVMKPVAEFARRKMAEEQQIEIAKGITEAVTAVKKTDGLDGVPDRIVTGLLHAAYSDDPQFRTAYDNRHANPSALREKLAEIASTLSEDMNGLTGSSARSDVEAAKAAVRGSGKVAEIKDAVDSAQLFTMNDVEFREYKRKLGSMN